MISLDVDIDNLINEIKFEVNQALVHASSSMAMKCRVLIREQVYSFKNKEIANKYVVYKLNRDGSATIRVIYKSFTLSQLEYTPPASREEPGWSLVGYGHAGRGWVKAFPVKFKRAPVPILVSRSGITHITEPEWQERQAKYPFSYSGTYINLTNLSRETKFKTYERVLPRDHAFIIPRTIPTVVIIEKAWKLIFEEFKTRFFYEMTHPRTKWTKRSRAKTKPSIAIGETWASTTKRSSIFDLPAPKVEIAGLLPR